MTPSDRVDIPPPSLTLRRTLPRSLLRRRLHHVAAGGRHKAVVRFPILVEARIRAQLVAGRKLLPGIAPIFSGFVRGVTRAREQVLVLIAGLSKAAEAG